MSKLTLEVPCGDGAVMSAVNPLSFEDGGIGLGPVGERIASAIRALKDSQPQTERQAE